MSAHIACTCRKRNSLRVIKERYKCNLSAFGFPKNGKKWSEYSTVVCINKGCMGMWRSKAKYVEELEQISFEEFEEILQNKHK